MVRTPHFPFGLLFLLLCLLCSWLADVLTSASVVADRPLLYWTLINILTYIGLSAMMMVVMWVGKTAFVSMECTAVGRLSVVKV